MKTAAFLCGTHAAKLLTQHSSTDILGIYSAGTYLVFPQNDILLITDRCRGYVPFGIGIHNYTEFCACISGKDISFVQIQPNGSETIRIIFSDIAEIEISLPSEEPSCLLDTVPKESSIKSTAKMLLEKKNAGFSAIASSVCESSVCEEYKDPYVKKAAVLTDKLLHELKNGNTSSKETARCLIGLGHGLTPSGDDLLCGIAYCLNYTPMLANAQTAAALLAEAIKENLHLTNIVSRRYLLSAANGDFFGAAADLIKALAENGKSIETALDAILNIGSSSGADITAGILKAYSVFLP